MADYGPYNPPTIDALSQTNTSAGDVVATSGAVGQGGNYEAWVFVGSSAAGVWEIARRNAANSADVGDVPTVRTLAGASSEFRVRFNLNPSERIVVRTKAGITGDIDAALYVEQLA